MKKLALIALTLSSFAANATNLHISPEIKIGAYQGAGIQLGVTDVLDLDAMFVSYNITGYESSIYDERIDSYRIGGQKMFGSNKTHGFQAEVGYAEYDGKRRTNHRQANGISIGGAYVFQASERLALRGGIDFNMFRWGNTYVPYDMSPTFNLGVILNL